MEEKSNAEEGGSNEFWGNDIDSELDDTWATVTARKLGLLDFEE